WRTNREDIRRMRFRLRTRYAGQSKPTPEPARPTGSGPPETRHPWLANHRETIRRLTASPGPEVPARFRTEISWPGIQPTAVRRDRTIVLPNPTWLTRRLMPWTDQAIVSTITAPVLHGTDITRKPRYTPLESSM